MNDSADLADGLYFQAVKNFSNVAFATDNDVLSLALSKAETVNTADSGVLLSQGYCDLTYFAEDYVGATRAF